MLPFDIVPIVIVAAVLVAVIWAIRINRRLG